MAKGKTLRWSRLSGLILLMWLSASTLIAQPDTSAGGPQRVYTGVYLMNVYDLDINAYSFYADFYLWFRWQGDLDPTNIEFINAVEKWGFTQNMFYEEPKELPDGSWYNGMRIEGRFYHSFELGSFPLDQHNLDIRVENVDYPIDSLVYVPDTGRYLLRQDFRIPGWIISDATIANHDYAYRTNFGEPTTSLPVFSNVTFTLKIQRPRSYFLLKLLLPMLIVLMASLGALFIHPRYLDARISLPIGGLLSLVFLQQAYSDALPDVGYMVLMDRIYLVAYFFIAAIMLKVIIAGNRQALEEGQIPWETLRKKDRRSAWVYLGVFTIIILILVALGK